MTSGALLFSLATTLAATPFGTLPPKQKKLGCCTLPAVVSLPPACRFLTLPAKHG